MLGVLQAIGVIVAIVLVGALLARGGVLTAGHGEALSRVVFLVATPALVVTVLQSTPLDALAGATTFATVICAWVLIALGVGAALLLRRGARESVLAGLAVSYVNAGNVGVALTTFVLGSAGAIIPALIHQLVVIAPVAFLVLDLTSGERRRWWRTLLVPLRNPITVACVLGLGLALGGIRLPDPVLVPLELLAGLVVPGALLAFGISIAARDVDAQEQEPARLPLVAVLSALRLLGGPLAALLIGGLALGLRGSELFTLLLVAALPTAQNVFVYAARYRVAVATVRAVVLVTTLGCIPVLVLIAALAAP